VPKTAAILATRNNELFIGEAVKSLAALAKGQDLAISILDDASSDGNWLAIQRAVEGLPNAKAVRAPSRMGAAKARRMLCESSDSEYILVVDGDDILLPGSLEPRLAFLDANPACAGAYGKMRMIDEAGALLPCAIGMPFSRFELAYLNMVCHPGHLLRRSAITEAGGYQETGAGADSVGEDHFLWYRMAMSHDFAFFDSFVCLYRIHRGQLTQLPAAHAKAASDWVLKAALSLRPDVSMPLLNGQPLSVDKGNWRAAMLALGAISRLVQPNSESFERILDLAERVDSRDFGVALKRGNLHLGRRDFEKALACADEILKAFPNGARLKLLALEMKRRALQGAGSSAAELIAVELASEEERLLNLP